ncbi:C-C motif chemokine 20-like [Mugil cephalus]|uniref:C-C motif chemokine 20-like n=1 Tax=Mugil cephalus TaxID=48193 RepID=UPI001FB577CD|nr:C-C motif chemokine 20-like [Mugil cephalus]
MQLSLVLTSLLSLIAWIILGHAMSAPAPTSDCCLQWSRTKLHPKQIRNYTIQSEGVCPIKAVVFLTVREKIVCSNPETTWVKNAILKVDRKKKVQLDKVATTIGMTPAPSTASTKGQNEDGSTSDLPDFTNYKTT